jgi:hypothetical protein
MGAPAVWPARVFEYTDPARILMTIDANNPKLVIGAIANKRVSFAISGAQYLLALGTIANVMSTSIELGDKAILAWGCTTTFLPLLWTCLASVIHVIAAASYIVARRSVRDKLLDEGNQLAGHLRSKRQMILHFVAKLWHELRRETTLCANKDTKDQDSTVPVPTWAVLLNIVAGCCSFIHIVFGTIVFSSFQFVSVWDVLNQILWRYALSTVICRLVLIIELAGLRSGSMVSQSSK